jgi:hypothetical protein
MLLIEGQGGVEKILATLFVLKIGIFFVHQELS